MFRFFRITISLIYLSFFLVFNSAHASLNADPLEEKWVYRTVEQLVAFGLLDHAILFQQPLSWKAIQKYAEEAQQNLSRVEGTIIEPRVRLLLLELKRQIPNDPPEKKIKMDPVRSVEAGYLFLDSPDRSVPQSRASSHQITARINPLVADRGGRPFVDGQNFSLETSHALYWEPYFSIVGQPQVFLQKNANGNDRFDANYDKLYLRSELKNVGIQFGRDRLLFGPGGQKGSVFSGNARGIDMFKISNVSPYRLPWILKYLGFLDTTFFFGVLENSREFPHAYVTGYVLSFLPHKNFQLSFTATSMSGGEGSPPASLGSRIFDPFFGYMINSVSGANPSDDFASNRLGAFDFKWRIPSWRGAEIYYGFTLDDLNTQYRFFHESFQRVGIYLPRLSNDGIESLRLEYNHAGVLPYRHAQFVSGWTRYNELMGDSLGPDSQAVHLTYDYSSNPAWEHMLAFSWEQRDSDDYVISGNDPIRRIADNPTETRTRGRFALNRHLKGNFWVCAQLGLEWVDTFNFQPGSDFMNFLSDVRLTWRLPQ
ncbi:MAG: capsule assembly Wzi family protein [Deltaproteobacteria bacterium]|nr:capsule assembly Wzi family protein [Deltaproteobacteria bacterium]